MMRELFVFVRSVVVITVVAFLAVVALATPALASGFALSHFGTICFQSFCAPSGVLEHNVIGRDRTITYQWAEVETVGPICNWKIDFVFRDDGGREYFRSPGDMSNTCANVAYRKYAPQSGGKQWQYGRTCAEVFTNGEFLTRACVDVVRPRDE
ncbi:hypothetical protein FB558_3149 [Pseudonocardia kunmingensis]|uniref:Uncharacterized protein n=2 Tax=Pseudonocardia kunmingensis TaxID=630975 RepID=A0A543E4E7_9PSEU|nr:hypothetical protein FB558_3149 [Pseudonocardia kunmingensis]